MADIGDAYQLLTPLLGTTLASTLFAVALLASGQNSTITGTLAGQIVMEGFLDIRLPAWLRRLITRLIAIIPAVIVTALYGEKGVGQPAHPEPGDPEPAALVRGGAAGALHQPEVAKMGEFVNEHGVAALAWSVTAVDRGPQRWLLLTTFRWWMSD